MLQALHLLTVPSTKTPTYEPAHLLSAGLCLALDSLLTDPTAGTPDSPPTSRTPRTPPLGSVDSPAIYTHGTLEHSAP